MYVIASKRLCTSFRCVCTLPRALPAVGLRRVCSEAGPSSEERKIKLDRTGMPLSERRRREARQRAFLQELPTPTSVSMRPIGIVRTPYTLRHDCPRQPMMPAAPGAAEPQEALATIELYEGLGLEASVRDLGGFDFIWLCFLFHANQHWRPEVRLPPDPTPRAPTLDLREPHAAAAAAAGAEVVRPRQRVGVLSTRSPHRPNPLGMSALRLVSVDPERRTLTVAGIDCLDRTPVLDVKPYVPWADAFPHARATWPSDTEG
jgi:tRNA (Thr-GGU) A37 N-methylase